MGANFSRIRETRASAPHLQRLIAQALNTPCIDMVGGVTSQNRFCRRFTSDRLLWLITGFTYQQTTSSGDRFVRAEKSSLYVGCGGRLRCNKGFHSQDGKSSASFPYAGILGAQTFILLVPFAFALADHAYAAFGTFHGARTPRPH